MTELPTQTNLDHTFYLRKLEELANNLPTECKSHFSHDLLLNLSKVLTDETLFMIVSELKDIQAMTERSLYAERQFLKNQRDCDKQRNLSIPSNNYDLETEKLINDKDIYIVNELDKLVEQQQTTLEKAGMPGFFVTPDPEYQRIQMYLLQFISALEFERCLL